MNHECQANDSDVGRPENRFVQYSRRREEMRFFLVACHQASVSVETMSRYLGLDASTIRSELLLGIEAWNVAQRRTNEAAFIPHLSIPAVRN